MQRFLLVLIAVAILTACSTQTGRYTQHKDSHPEQIASAIDFSNVVPKYEPYTPSTLRPYTVLGKRYNPMKTGKGYSASGNASWYGQKFHGHKTSNGEIYDMFAMTGAHKTLPLPSIVRVTNLANGRQTIVRVNDRGPFHPSRIIDLSYAAAIKLDFIDTGVAKVKIDVMYVDEFGQLTVGNQHSPELSEPIQNHSTESWYVQIAALSDSTRLTELVKRLKISYKIPVHTPIDGNLVRLRLGPIDTEAQAETLLEKIKGDGYNEAFKVFAAP
jgi:rare lipoprotein A